MLQFKRHFTVSGLAVEKQFEWGNFNSKITDVHGKVLFEREGLFFPKSFSQLAIDITASKYFRKKADGDWESSLEELVERVADTLTSEGLRQGYFDTENAEVFYSELKYVIYSQSASFNSPVFFNCGLFEKNNNKSLGRNYVWNSSTQSVESTEFAFKNPQCSACFIQSVDDDLMGIFELAKREAKIFKYGSGTGSNFSRIRGKDEKLSGGGESSGLMSFLKFLDQGAAVIKSGGTTRRAAKMVCLDIDHPEAIDFINWKVREEEKVRALVQAGFSSDFNGEAYATVSGQNSNNSVRVTDAFMNAKEKKKTGHLSLEQTNAKCLVLKQKSCGDGLHLRLGRWLILVCNFMIRSIGGTLVNQVVKSEPVILVLSTCFSMTPLATSRRSISKNLEVSLIFRLTRFITLLG